MNSQDLDDRIRRALRAQTEQLTESELRPALPPTSRTTERRQWRRWGLPLLAAAAVAAIAIGTTVVASSLKSAPTPPASSTSNISPSPSPSVTHPSPSTSRSQASQSPGASKTQPPATTFDLGYQPLWPFADFAAAERWRTTAGGSQPWHADPEQTALSFVSGYLGFVDPNRITSHVMDAAGAHIGVGYLNPSGVPHTAAVLHLVRFGTASDAPWEVVGSDDTDFSLEQPAYGSTVSSPMTVGGHITGVDESLHITVRQLGTEAPVGQNCCQPAGGQNSPWTQQVSFTGSGVLTIVVSTGGHLKGVERFAIQGVVAR
jgi:hypothetical protein